MLSAEAAGTKRASFADPDGSTGRNWRPVTCTVRKASHEPSCVNGHGLKRSRSSYLRHLTPATDPGMTKLSPKNQFSASSCQVSSSGTRQPKHRSTTRHNSAPPPRQRAVFILIYYYWRFGNFRQFETFFFCNYFRATGVVNPAGVGSIIDFFRRFYYNNLLTKLSHGRTRGAQGLCLANKLEEQMTIEFESLPREKQRVEIIRMRAMQVWLESTNPDQLANWQIAEQQLCDEKPEFRIAKAIYRFISSTCKVSIEEIADAQPLQRYITNQLEYNILLAKILWTSNRNMVFLPDMEPTATIGEFIDILVAKGA